MSFSIQTNVNALIAQENLRVNSNFQGQTIQRLTSGYRINASGDDAAGLAIANKFRSDTAELSQGVRNANDGISQLQIIDGGMNNVSKMLDRLRTLATQSASGTFIGKRDVVNSEFQSLLSEIDRQAQSIGLNTGGAFARSLDVYIGSGSGSTSIGNAMVSLDLSKSTVDSQSLGLKGMEAVNVTGSLNGTNIGTDIGASAGNTSVENIVKASTGNAMATAGYAAFQFSGAGFSDAGKVTVAVNLSGVTDVSTLAANLNSAIMTAGNGNSAAATAFKNANIVASVHTDSGGRQQLAFSSSSTAFQVQAGDQMANALLGNVNGSGVGAAVNTPTVTGVTTASSGTFATPANVHLVISGGGLASTVSLQLASNSTTITAAIDDFKNQFSASPLLVAAGLTMSGSSTAGAGALSFNSKNGQQFNVQVTGDSANLLGLGSFLAGNSGEADYVQRTATTAYSAATVTGSSATTGTAAGLEISLNGQQAVALTPVDLTAGAHATAASATSSASIGGGAVDITNSNKNLDITVINNGVSTNQVWALSTNQVATSGAVVSTVTSANIVTSPVTVSAASHSNEFTVAVDGGTAVTLTVGDGVYNTANGFLTAIQGAIAGSSLAGDVTAGWATGTNVLTLTSVSTGVTSSVAIGDATYATAATMASSVTSANIVTSPVTVSAAGNSEQFNVAVNGGPSVTLTVADGVYNTANGFLTAIQGAIAGSSLGGTVTAGWAAGTNALTFTTVATGDTASVNVSAVSGNSGLANIGLLADTNRGSSSAVNSGRSNLGLSVGGSSGLADAPATIQSIAADIQSHFAGTATVTVTNDNKISIASFVKGANSSVTVNATANSANATLNLTAPTTVAGLNSSIADIVDNLNAQFSSSATWRAADLQATAGDGSHVTIISGNNTYFRLDALGGGLSSAEDIGFGVAGTSFTAATPTSATAMSALAAFGISNSTAQDFTAMAFGSDSQAITISANESTGALQTKTITLQNTAGNRSGRSIDDAVAYINQQLQQSISQPALQKIIAVKENDGGFEKINFVSSLGKFTVGVGSSTNGAGIANGVPTQIVSIANGDAATISVDTQDGAKQAVTALAAAIASLGSAQAAIGKGQNQLNYAVTLAQSQISNFSAAESRIRDADVAAEAANLTKAQVLQQASLAAMAQANSAPQAVLALLRG